MIIVNDVINFHWVTSSEELFPCSVQILTRLLLERTFTSTDCFATLSFSSIISTFKEATLLVTCLDDKQYVDAIWNGLG